MNPQFVLSLITILVVIHLILISVAYCIMLERKISAWAQNRIGPNRTGFSFGQDNWLPKVGLGFLTKHCFGLGQPLADGAKLLLKEDYTPPGVDKTLFKLAPMLAVVPALIAWAVMPWGGYLQWGDQTLIVAAAPVNVGVVYILAVGSLAVYGVVIAGYASNNKYAFLGGLRATAQMLSYEIPLGLSVLMIALITGSLRADFIAATQVTGMWNIVYMPLLAVIFFTCLLAEANRAPFDLAECEQELVAGFHTEFSSMKFALFFLAEYIHVISGSAFFVLMFLGGWHIPFLDLPMAGGIGLVLLNAGVFFSKVALMVAFVMLVRWTLPRFRFDQLMKLAWRSMIPLTLVLLLLTSLVVAMDWPRWTLLLMNVGAYIGAIFISPLMPQGPNVNRRIPLAGSRFNPLPKAV